MNAVAPQIAVTPPQPFKGMNIAQRINWVRTKIDYIKKDGTIKEGGNYTVVTHDNVTAHIRGFLVEAGVLIYPSLLSAKVELTGSLTAKGAAWIRYEAMFDIIFQNCDDLNDKIVSRIEAHALDMGDKAPGKAVSYAKKAAVLKMFEIETGDDEEQRPEDVMQGMPVKVYADWEAAIDAISSIDGVQTVWEKIHESCTGFKDAVALTKLKGRLSAKNVALKKLVKRVPAKRPEVKDAVTS